MYARNRIVAASTCTTLWQTFLAQRAIPLLDQRQVSVLMEPGTSQLQAVQVR